MLRWLKPRDLWWIVPLLVADAALLIALRRHYRAPAEVAPPPAPPPAVAEAPPPPALSALRFPTAQARLLDPPTPATFQPTASGNVESALYGSVRTAQMSGGGFASRFHEGIDIAAVARDRQGRPTDEVWAVADGRVAFVNRVAGNSDYGRYVVLLHDDPVGEVYTLYAHLQETEGGLAAGRPVRGGDRLGLMGNTALDPIPMARAHLHFEIGLVNNSRFAAWAARQKQQTPGGNYNGQNLTGVHPLQVFEAQRAQPEFSFLAHVRTIPTAFEFALRRPRQLDFFARYPALWSGPPFDGQAMVCRVSEGGLLLGGRNATADEAAALAPGRPVVLSADETVLDRNGRRLVQRQNGAWVFARNGTQWLELLTCQ